MLYYIVNFFAAFVTSILLTYLVKSWARKRQIIDSPQPRDERKIHARAIPLLGGLAVYLSFTLVIFIYAFFIDELFNGYLLFKHVLGITIAGGIIMVGGYLDDRYNLKPKQQIIWPVLAGLAIIASGIGVSYISNPFGGTLYLDHFKTALFSVNGLPYNIVWLADIFTLVWLMGTMYTTKVLDGLDGLVTGVGVIGSFIIFFLSISPTVGQPETGLIAVTLAGALLGFLLFNFHPAKIFLGEGGALYVGFMLGVLSILSGGKIATALLIMGLPILDLLWVIIRRWFWERKSPFKTADKKHLHFRLLDVGLSQRQVVMFLYLITAIFGIAGLFLQGKQKFYALLILLGVMLLLAVMLVIVYKRKKEIRSTKHE